MAESAQAVAPELVLASGSPFRRRMLEAAGLSFRVVPADVDEAAIKDSLGAKCAPSDIAEVLARAKAEAVSARLPESLVIGADQVLALGNDIFSKPAGAARAREQLLQLRGQSHHLHTAAALAIGAKTVWHHLETATLVMRPFSEQFLDRYLAAAGGDIGQSVGGYKIEDRGVQLFERIDGDYFGIIGLPLLALLAELRHRGVIDR
jgi:septum formation protein